MTATMIALRRHHHRRTRLTLALGLITGLLMANQGLAQEQAPHHRQREDPRVGLAGGFLDAVQAVHNM